MQLYQIGKQIGTGSFGVVFLCKHKEEKKYYVAKRLSFGELDGRGKENIENQLKLLQTFRHPNIVPFKDSFIVGRQLYIIMVYCDAGSLLSRIRSVKEKGKFFTEAQILDWFAQIALAIHYLHSKRILHRDLKSQNLFLKLQEKNERENYQRVRLGDFGIAKVLDDNQDLTATTAIGTPLYMAPEVFNRNIYSYKSDIWSLGCIVYEMCNLRTPFDAQSHNGLIMKVIKGSYPTISPVYSKQLRDLIGQMLEKKAINRPSIIEIINKPFIKHRVEKYVRDTLSRNEKQIDLDDVYLDSLREQARILDIPLHEQTIFKKRRKTVYEGQNEPSTMENHSLHSYMSQEQFSEQRYAFIDKKKEEMMKNYAINDKPIRDRTSHKQELKYEQISNMEQYRVMEKYPMEDEEIISSIEEDEEEYDSESEIEESLNFEIEKEYEIYQSTHNQTYLKLYNQIQVLKNTCENGLGLHKFLSVYKLVEKGANRQVMAEILGEDQIGYWHLIDQALYYESVLKGMGETEQSDYV